MGRIYLNVGVEVVQPSVPISVWLYELATVFVVMQGTVTLQSHCLYHLLTSSVIMEMSY